MDPQEAATPAGAVMATGTSYQTEGRLGALPPDLNEIVASYMELADKLATFSTFSASSSLLKAIVRLEGA